MDPKREVSSSTGTRRGIDEPAKDGRRLLDGLATMRFLAESAKDLNSTLNLDEVFQKIADRISRVLDHHLFCIMLWNEKTHTLEHSYSLRYGKHLIEDGGFVLGQGLSGTCAKDRRPVRVADVLDDPRYIRHRHAEVEIRSEVVVPLVVKDRLIGILDVESEDVARFTEEHEQLLVALAAHIAIAVDNARLYGEVRETKRKLESDLATARVIQKSLLPALPTIDGIDIGAAYVPARILGGDFYDFLPYDDGRLALAVGDIEGKSTPAALFGSMTIGIMRGHTLETSRSPGDMLEHLNRELRVADVAERFACILFGVLDPKTWELTLGNSGCPSPLRIRHGAVEDLELYGLPLGVLPGGYYEEIRIVLQPGDVIIVRSDGLQDCRDENGDCLGDERLRSILAGIKQETAQGIADEIIAATDRFAGTATIADDRTVVVLKAAD